MRCSLGRTLTGWMLLLAVTGNAQAAEIALIPVGADGAHTIVGNEIRLANPGQRVFLEVQIGAWDPTGVRLLRGWQATIDSSGYSNGTLGVLTPASLPCLTPSDCSFGFGGACSVSSGSCMQDGDCPFPQANDFCKGPLCDFPVNFGGFCTPAFILSSRADYIFAGLTGGDLPIVDVGTPDFRFASAALSEFRVDPGTPLYAATLVLDIPISASGVYEIGFRAGTPTTPASQLLADDFARFEPLTLAPARIVVAECAVNADCNDNNACTTDVCRVDDTCGHAPNFNDTQSCCDPQSGDLCTKARGILGDGNGDGRVDLRDFAPLQSRCFGAMLIPFRCEPLDTDCNCRVNVGDLPNYIAGMNGPVAP